MGAGTANLSGSGPQQVYVWVSYHSMDQPNNRTRWYWELIFKNNGGLQWSADPNHYGRVDGFAVGGNYYFGIPNSWVGTGDHMINSGLFWKTHNADGYLSADTLDGTIVTTHTSIGSGTASAATGTPPRVPKKPDAPPAPTFVSADADVLRFTIYGPSDNGGSTVLDYEIQVLEEVSSASDLVGSWTGATGSAQTTEGKVELDPSTKYRIRYRARNAYGYSAYSATTTMETEGGMYVSTGSAWVGTSARVSTGSAWVSDGAKISDGDSWEDPLDV